VVDQNVLRRKIAQVLHHCDRLERRCGLSARALAADEDLANAVLMNLQQAIQACIDIAIHTCVDDSIGTPPTPAQAFAMLAREHRIDTDLAERLSGAAGLRNLIVHQYTDLDYTRIIAVIGNNLNDLKQFVAVVSQR